MCPSITTLSLSHVIENAWHFSLLPLIKPMRALRYMHQHACPQRSNYPAQTCPLYPLKQILWLLKTSERLQRENVSHCCRKIIKSRPSAGGNWFKSLLKNSIIFCASLHEACVLHIWPMVTIHETSLALLYKRGFYLKHYLVCCGGTKDRQRKKNLSTMKNPAIKIQNAKYLKAKERINKISFGTFGLQIFLEVCTSAYPITMKSRGWFVAFEGNPTSSGNLRHTSASIEFIYKRPVAVKHEVVNWHRTCSRKILSSQTASFNPIILVTWLRFLTNN